MFKYEWKETYNEIIKIISKQLIEKVFDILNKSTAYVDVNGKFVGYISAVDGPLGIIHIISDHSLTIDTLFVFIKIIYLDKKVLYLVIDGENLIVYDFLNGHWANTIMRIK